MDKEKIKFNDLSTPLKTAVIITFIIGGIYALAFLVGFISVLFEV